ncbi:hypothetical protein [Albidovulum sp.]|uniref:hypothetical protein n=1 Tax=Albidovulum sp. TaxID=1872424 RepID=UPI002B7CC556|nr:hypothetical protein [Albidovulum sp.]
MPDASTANAAAEIESLIASARKAPHNFVLMKTKDGVAIEGHKTKTAKALIPLVKAKGGMPAVSCMGQMEVTGKLITLKVEDEKVPGTLPKLAKRYFKSLGIHAKIQIALPSGELISDGEDEEGAPGTDAAPDEAETGDATEAPVRPLDHKGDLEDRIKTLIPLVKAAIEKGVAGADRLPAAMKQAAGAVAKDAFELAENLVAAIEKIVGQAGTPSGGEGDERTRLETEFRAIGADFLRLTKEAPPLISGKAVQVANLFRSELDKDLKKADQVLTLLKKFLSDEIGKLGSRPEAPKNRTPEETELAQVSEPERKSLEKLKASEPKAYAAAIDALREIRAKGWADMSPAGRQKSAEDTEKTRQAAEKARTELASAKGALTKAMQAHAAAGTEKGEAQLAMNRLDQAIRDLTARAGDVTKLSPDALRTYRAEAQKLVNDREAAKKTLADATEKERKAAEIRSGAQATVGTAETKLKSANDAHDTAFRKQEAAEARKGIMDAVAFGPLSADAKPPFADADKAAFIRAFAKDSRLAETAMAAARGAKDPSAVARNAEMVAGAYGSGFADAQGNRLDLPPDQMRGMAENALKMGAQLGEDYFKGFSDYMASGKQLAADPHGGMDKPKPGEDRDAFVNRVSLNRTRAMGAAAVRPDGAVDFASGAASDAMNDMLFHPGALNTCTPQLTAKMVETRGLFTNPATAPQAQKIVKDTKLPDRKKPGFGAATTLIAGTCGKGKDGLGDNDARAAVLSAMMTPLSQGPVGSCFSTAPVRGIREETPLKAMEEFSKIASTGQYKATNGSIYPANTTLPEGENPLMRSFEYSVATAAAEDLASIERDRLQKAVFNPADTDGLAGLKDVIGKSKWKGGSSILKGIIPGVEAKLKKALAKDLKFEYNAGPQVGGPSGGGGDGHSTQGAYEIKYKGKALVTEQAFMDAIKEIALGAAGEKATSSTGKAILDHVSAPAFRDSIVKSMGGTNEYLPWKLADGGFEWQTQQVLHGGKPGIYDMTPASDPPPSEAERTSAVIKGMMAKQGDMSGGMSLISTRGDNANHAFNALPTDPSFDKLRGGNIDDKIRDELVDPGKKIATTKLPRERAAKMYEDQIKTAMQGKPDADRDLLVKALKNAPAADMTPAEIKTKVATEMAAWRDVQAQRELDEWFAADNAKLKREGKPERANSEKAGYLDWFKNKVDGDIKGEIDAVLMQDLAMPEVVMADTNWGGPEGQVFFVAAPDPSTGDLKLWKKTMPGGKMQPAGDNWAQANWYEIH